MKTIKQTKYILCLVVIAFCLCSLPEAAVPSDNHEIVPLQPGAFLVAKPHLADPNFRHSVILLVSYGKEGATGVVINRPSYVQLRHVVPELKGLKGAAIPLFKGGPVDVVDINILFTSDKSREGTKQVFDNVYFTGKKELILSLLQERPVNTMVRVYAGYAGWAPGQLEHEIMRGDWITIKADVKKIFAEEPARIWPSIFSIREELMI